jgi:hypothetical protein
MPNREVVDTARLRVPVGSRTMTTPAGKRLENTATLFARKREFGFVCPAFSLEVSNDGFVLPRSAKQLLHRALITAKVATRDITGRYHLAIHYDGRQFCNVPVIVAWGSHPALGAGFLALKVLDEQKLRRALKPLAGKDVELVFRPRLAPQLGRPAGARA